MPDTAVRLVHGDPSAPSHARGFSGIRFDYETEAEPVGQLVCCLSGGLELFGHAGEWVIPPEHMVYIPPDRMFRLRARVVSSGIVCQFSHREVAWIHDGCWVAQMSEFASGMIGYAAKWDRAAAGRSRHAASFFVTLGEMLPAWFDHERIFWTPYAESSSIQRAIDFAHRCGPSVSLQDVAGHVGMSERTLRRHMQTELGQSWREFIRELRMKLAMDMLRRGDRSVTETAFEVGFSSSSAFSSAFLSYVGRTPSAYARAFRGQRALH